MNYSIEEVVRVAAARILLILGAASLGACVSTAGIAPSEKLPTKDETAAKLQLSATTASSPLPSETWWSVYNDQELNRWIETGLAQNPTLKEASARLSRAEAAFASAQASKLPKLDFQANSTSERFSNNGIFPPPIGGEVATDNDIDLAASLELDLFGRLQSRIDAAHWQAAAGVADRDLARVRLAGAIAHAYFDLARAQRARQIAVEIEESRGKVLGLVRDRVAAGLDTQVERRLAEVTIPEVRVEIERANEQIALARHALALLAGQAPQAADGVDARLPADAMLAPPANLPLDLLSRRADVVAAQLRAVAALRSVDATRADFYPNISISALAGLDALGTRHLFEGESRNWQVEPAIHLPLFDGGSLRAQLRSASAEADTAIDTYNATVLQAAGEVADASSSIASVQRQRAQQMQATEQAQAAMDLAAIRYQAGLGNYLTVLTAQGNLLTQRRAQVELDGRAAALDVNLALALGGGFQDQQTADSGAGKTDAPSLP
jgi:NodT family efflux transporter outer membrane factor (OMF) lipoprotein